MNSFMKSLFKTGEVVRGNRRKYCVYSNDTEIKINKRTSKVMEFAYMNIFGKIYFIEEDGAIRFLREDKYNEYEWRICNEQG